MFVTFSRHKPTTRMIFVKNTDVVWDPNKNIVYLLVNLSGLNAEVNCPALGKYVKSFMGHQNLDGHKKK